MQMHRSAFVNVMVAAITTIILLSAHIHCHYLPNIGGGDNPSRTEGGGDNPSRRQGGGDNRLRGESRKGQMRVRKPPGPESETWLAPTRKALT